MGNSNTVKSADWRYNKSTSSTKNDKKTIVRVSEYMTPTLLTVCEVILETTTYKIYIKRVSSQSLFKYIKDGFKARFKDNFFEFFDLLL